MITVRRPVHAGYGRVNHAVVHIAGYAGRPCSGPATSAGLPASMSGPGYKGMDPSDPLTYVRPWAPAPGMIAYLNFDGASLQSTAPTGGLQRGRQSRRRG